MKIELKKLTLYNFKGVKEKVVKFGHSTNILGDNGTGKTTIFDAFVWLLFGKNSADQKDFNIKTLDGNNNALTKLEHEVRAEILVDTTPVQLRRVFKEKWIKKRGEQDAEFAGHETLFYYNGVPLQAAEYKQKIDAIANESIFKLVTNAWAFNGMKWQDRRAVLIELAGSIQDTDVFDKIATLQNKQDVVNLTNILNSKKTLAEYSREIAARKKKLSDDLKQIPSRIDELQRGKPENEDYAAIQIEIEWANDLLKEIDASIADQSKAFNEANKYVLAHQANINGKRNELVKLEQQIRFDYQNESNKEKLTYRNLQNQIEAIKQDITSKSSLLASRNKRIEELNIELEKLRKSWGTAGEETLIFSENQFCCPTCNREFEAEDIGVKKILLQQNFDQSKAEKVAKISKNGKDLNNEVAEYKAMTVKLEEAITDLQEELKISNNSLDKANSSQKNPQSVDQILLSCSERVNFLAEIATLEATAPQPEEINLSYYNAQKAGIVAEIDNLKTRLGTRDQIAKINLRFKELTAEERSLSQQIADLERTEFVIDDFNRAKIDMVESRINGKFNLVRFKMYDKQINGGEVETCETLISGVPFSDANTASKINAGIDVINTLCQHYNVYAPIFCDNAESINEILPTESQLIRLVVTKDKYLQVA